MEKLRNKISSKLRKNKINHVINNKKKGSNLDNNINYVQIDLDKEIKCFVDNNNLKYREDVLTNINNYFAYYSNKVNDNFIILSNTKIINIFLCLILKYLEDDYYNTLIQNMCINFLYHFTYIYNYANFELLEDLLFVINKINLNDNNCIYIIDITTFILIDNKDIINKFIGENNFYCRKYINYFENIGPIINIKVINSYVKLLNILLYCDIDYDKITDLNSLITNYYLNNDINSNEIFNNILECYTQFLLKYNTSNINTLFLNKLLKNIFKKIKASDLTVVNNQKLKYMLKFIKTHNLLLYINDNLNNYLEDLVILNHEIFKKVPIIIDHNNKIKILLIKFIYKQSILIDYTNIHYDFLRDFENMLLFQFEHTYNISDATFQYITWIVIEIIIKATSQNKNHLIYFFNENMKIIKPMFQNIINFNVNKENLTKFLQFLIDIIHINSDYNLNNENHTLINIFIENNIYDCIKRLYEVIDDKLRSNLKDQFDYLFDIFKLIN